ncbi:type I-E CRISPR-associated protein Cse2/CasB [Lactobacillus sp.]|uniref:type I-E CRISPR-associated protein Cse2/CasB n=1 Tax=Lactobacillus sp. TaxID=1591 RepID=UPI001994D45C|nr:type I-E CRISPR-associated protein Cse2/CasB [Lactobacillus sp.]MBD5430103.1 type I-E CRISPR-associated protein Cse2/CasB [Lactobacillus sp.]MBD5430583.1 type I-E CRISPR-associated protein Cse2/CasB [Lactobacillus sp.]
MSNKKNTIRSITARIIYQLYNNGEINKGVLATLRRTTSMADKGAEKVWPFIFDNIATDNKNAQINILSTNGNPTRQENAIYTALHCYAMFQQGIDQTCVYAASTTRKDEEGSEEKGLTLFSALRMVKNSDSKVAEALDRRVTVLLATTNINSAIKSITHLVSMLKGKKLGFKIDFAQLASDLNVFQISPKTAREIALKWGRDYYWNTYALKNQNEEN